MLDGLGVEPSEQAAANDMFVGRLTEEALVEKAAPTTTTTTNQPPHDAPATRACAWARVSWPPRPAGREPS